MQIGDTLDRIISHSVTGRRVATFRVTCDQVFSDSTKKAKLDKQGKPISQAKFSMTFHENVLVQLSEKQADDFWNSWMAFKEGPTS